MCVVYQSQLSSRVYQSAINYYLLPRYIPCLTTSQEKRSMSYIPRIAPILKPAVSNLPLKSIPSKQELIRQENTYIFPIGTYPSLRRQNPS